MAGTPTVPRSPVAGMGGLAGGCRERAPALLPSVAGCGGLAVGRGAFGAVQPRGRPRWDAPRRQVHADPLRDPVREPSSITTGGTPTRSQASKSFQVVLQLAMVAVATVFFFSSRGSSGYGFAVPPSGREG